MKKYDFFKKDGLRPSAEQLLQTKAFYQHSGEIYAHFDQWKDLDRFYFIPLYLEMTYSLGWVAEIAPDPVWLGSFVRCNLEHPDLFQIQCPQCNQPVLPFRYAGSPLSGRVDLEYECSCGNKGFETVSGWQPRAIVLRDQIAADTSRFRQYKKHHPETEFATIDDLREYLKTLWHTDYISNLLHPSATLLKGQVELVDHIHAAQDVFLILREKDREGIAIVKALHGSSLLTNVRNLLDSSYICL